MNWLRNRSVRRLFCVGVAGCLLAVVFSSSVSAEGASHAAPIVYQGQGIDRNIALTFDDGPHGLYTAEILDILAEYGVHATFFVIGENADRYPELLQREIAEGHEVGNHTQSHPLKNLPHEQMEAEISACEKTIGEWIDQGTRLFRPPGGIISQTVMTLAESHQYRVILWSIDTRDWAHPPIEQITKTVLEQVEAGDIILMHDGIDLPSPTPAALRILIPALLAQGYRFVTVSELLGEG